MQSPSQTIHGLSNHAYHFEQPYADYLSSSQLKWYAKSPRYFLYRRFYQPDEPEGEKTNALRFGSLFHDLMSSCAERYDNGTEAIGQWLRGVAVFEPPKNGKTGQPYGSSTKVYKEAYDAFLRANKGKTVATDEEMSLAQKMCRSLLIGSGATSEQARKLLKWGEPEVSFFYKTEEGVRLKVRPDLLTRKKIVDWKTTTSDDLTEDAINRMILKYGYHISAAMYQYVVHEITGKWLDFLLVVVSKTEPHDCVMVDMGNYGYRYIPEHDLIVPGPGAVEFKKLLDIHSRCLKENRWPGAEQAIPGDNGVKILEIQPPRYYSQKFIDEM